MRLTRSEYHVLRRLIAGKSPGCALIVRFLLRKGLAELRPDRRVAATPEGRAAFAAHRRAG